MSFDWIADPAVWASLVTLTAMEIVPFVLFSLPAGVWLDRVKKLPVYIAGECAIGLSVASVPLAWWAGWLTIHWLYVVGLVIGLVTGFITL